MRTGLRAALEDSSHRRIPFGALQGELRCAASHGWGSCSLPSSRAVGRPSPPSARSPTSRRRRSRSMRWGLMDRATEALRRPPCRHGVIDRPARQGRTSSPKDGRDNDISTEQWRILIDPGRNLLGGFLGALEGRSPGSRRRSSARPRDSWSDAFDTIIGLESGKLKPDQVR